MNRYRLAVLGDPVAHSRSPEIHRAMLQLAGLEGEYLKIRADVPMLERTVEELRNGSWHGLNVTMPLKARAASLADDLSPRAERARSVNTLARRDQRVYGESTDSSAFHELFASEQFGGLTSLLVLGAGGSAAAALTAVPGELPVYVAARRMGKAEELVSLLGGSVAPWGAGVAGALVVNTTPIGMSGELLPERVLEVAGGLIDLPYGADPTPAVGHAEALGIPWADGHEFLLRQAIASFRLWTGVDLTLAALSEHLRKP